MASDLQPELLMDPKSFWGAVGVRAVGAAIVTTLGKGGPSGFLALSATHLTASPPLMTVSIDQKTSALSDVEESGAFAVNYLDLEGRDIFERFTSREGPKGAERFSGLELSTLSTGAPILAPITGALDCRVEEAIERFGTVLVIGRIVNFVAHKTRLPLIHYQGKIQP